MKIDRRVSDRNADEASNRRLRKLFGAAVLATFAVYLLLKYKRLI